LRKTSDFPPEVLSLFDQYVHNLIDRRGFLGAASKFATAGLTAAALLEALSPRFAEAQQVRPRDPRIKADYIEFPSPSGYGRGRGYLAQPSATAAGSQGRWPGVLARFEPSDPRASNSCLLRPGSRYSWRAMLADGVQIERGPSGLERIVIDAAEATAHVYLHGAQVTHFQPRDARPLLFLSRESQFVGGMPGKAIRGGVPICFPWFGPKADDAAAPAHGFARLLPWEVDDVTRDDRGLVRVSLRLSANDYTRRFFPHDFEALLAVTVDARLHLELLVHNSGSAPMVIEEALHTYFAVGDISRVSIHGLEEAPYVDKTAGFARRPGDQGPLAIERETDRLYPEARGTVTIEDPAWARRIVVRKAGSATTVVWNPWIDKARAMADFGDDEWNEMVCVETANAMADAVTIAPGEAHAMSATIEAR
jgi:D-hexose-6-phosphate mutarotase